MLRQWNCLCYVFRHHPSVWEVVPWGQLWALLPDLCPQMQVWHQDQGRRKHQQDVWFSDGAAVIPYLWYKSLQTNLLFFCLFFQEVPCATIQTEGEVKITWNKCKNTTCRLWLLFLFYFRGARLYLREALQQETFLWPTQMWRTVLCGE